ncbi:hypothetical protein [Frankia sp. R43]|nr:hypothetical protein [Frankia sp. R43]
MNAAARFNFGQFAIKGVRIVTEWRRSRPRLGEMLTRRDPIATIYQRDLA